MKFITLVLLIFQTCLFSKTYLIIHMSDNSQRQIDTQTIKEIAFEDASGSKIDANMLSLAKSFLLFQNHPNPFNPATTISFQIQERGPVEITIFDLKGRIVLQHSKEYNSGTNSFNWTGINAQGLKVASGFYIYQVKYNNSIQSKKMTFIK